MYKFYGDIGEMETLIEEVETKLYNINQEKKVGQTEEYFVFLSSDSLCLLCMQPMIFLLKLLGILEMHWLEQIITI